MGSQLSTAFQCLVEAECNSPLVGGRLEQVEAVLMELRLDYQPSGLGFYPRSRPAGWIVSVCDSPETYVSISCRHDLANDTLCENALVNEEHELIYDCTVGYDDVRRFETVAQLKQHLIELVHELSQPEHQAQAQDQSLTLRLTPTPTPTSVSASERFAAEEDIGSLVIDTLLKREGILNWSISTELQDNIKQELTTMIQHWCCHTHAVQNQQS